MVVNASELFSMEKLEQHIADGLVYARRHEELPLTVYKYSEAATYKRVWDEVTTRTRGLILHDDGTVVARAFDKFFNYSQLEPLGLSVDVDESGVIMSKMDGSLGIVFRFQDQWHVATQGSFASEQALHATELFRARYAYTVVPDDMTLLVEVIYPQNRIVSSYGELDDLVLLAGMTHSGEWVHPDDVDFAGPKVPMHRGNVREALTAEDPGDLSEGFVVRTDSGVMVKFKFPSYVSAHKARFSITALNVWRNLSEGTFEENMLIIPDEFHDEVKVHESVLRHQFNELWVTVEDWGSQLPDNDDRKERAQWINTHVEPSVRSLVMGKFVAGRDIEDGIWKAIRPNGSL